MEMMRIGVGYDTHRLIKRRKLVLGGVNIPFHKGLHGHSDADVLLHALCDALLGACAQGDIGEHFPDAHAAYKGISSIKLLRKVQQILRRLNYAVVNIDSTIIAERPHLGKYKKEMCAKIAQGLGLSLSQVNVKATTAEGLGPLGRGQAIAAYAVVLVKKVASREK